MASSLKRRAVGGCALMVLLALAANPARSATLYADATKPCPGLGTQAAPYCKIQSAICHSAAGDLVSVAPGTYNESLRMRPGVSVISTGGYTVTTINGAGKPCIHGLSSPPDPVNDYCTPNAGSTQCSVVVFGSNFTNADRLDGFTITGGKGIDRSAESRKRIAGGGIFSVSSPTISNNLITANYVAGPEEYYFGGGIYLNATTTAAPVITRNTITGNSVIPVAGSNNNPTWGIGGGIYSGFGASSTISQNAISGNLAGNANIANELGYGAGISVYMLIGGPDTVVTRNLIASNVAKNFGGGIYVGCYAIAKAHTTATITNNEIRGNAASGGGAISTFYSIAKIANNTIVGNSAFRGGALFVDQGGAADTVAISNNLITGNGATDAVGGGGGLYVRNLAPLTPLTVRKNDFFANTPAGKQVGGARNDAGTCGVDGNICVDPLYINATANNYHLAAGSPAIDAGNNADAAGLAVDADGSARVVDGNADGTAVVDMGEYELALPDADGDGTPDVADPCPLDQLNDQDIDGVCAGNAFNPPKVGKNDNCATVANPQQTDTDLDGAGDACDLCPGDALNDQDGDGICAGAGFKAPKTGDRDNCAAVSNTTQDDADIDGTGDACDPDIDGDGYLNAQDCAPRAPSVHAPPASPVGATLIWSSKSTLNWQRVPFSQANTYNVYRGTLPAQGLRGAYNHTCFEEDSPDPRTSDVSPPAAGASFYYLVSGRNRCGESTLGTRSGGQPRPVGAACPLVLRDSDGDRFDDVDDNCPIYSNPAQADADHDGIGDSCDNDSDNDGVDDALDCAPNDPNVFTVPTEVTGLTVRKAPATSLSWTAVNAGSATRYDVATGKASDLRGGAGFGPGTCLANDRTTATAPDTRSSPPVGNGWYYMVRAQNSCGTSTYGSTARNTHGSSGGACP